MMRCVLRCILEGRLRVLEVLEALDVLDVPEVIRCVLFCMLEAAEVGSVSGSR